MGYCANGNGSLTLKNEEQYELIEGIFENNDYGLELGYLCDNVVHFYTNVDKYYEEDVIEGLNAIKDCIVEGELEFVGEDGENWKFIFANGNWEEYDGTITYDCDPIDNSSLIEKAAKNFGKFLAKQDKSEGRFRIDSFYEFKDEFFSTFEQELRAGYEAYEEEIGDYEPEGVDDTSEEYGDD